MKTEKEIIEEIANFYTSLNRGYDQISGSCVYISTVGDTTLKCAVGRCMTDEGLEKYGMCDGGVDSLSYMLDDDKTTFDSILKPEYHGHSLDFWQHLQVFHDHGCNWTITGMSDIGKKAKETLLKDFANED